MRIQKFLNSNGLNVNAKFSATRYSGIVYKGLLLILSNLWYFSTNLSGLMDLKKFIGMLFFMFFFVGLQAQQAVHVHELLPASENDKDVLVVQDSRLSDILTSQRDFNARRKTIPGWRIQIYFATGRGAKEGAENLRDEFLSKHPDQKAYITYFAPYFKVYVGNFRNKHEAAHYRLQIIDEYPDAWLVKDRIEWPDL